MNLEVDFKDEVMHI